MTWTLTACLTASSEHLNRTVTLSPRIFRGQRKLPHPLETNALNREDSLWIREDADKPGGRPIVQWRRLDAGRSDALRTGKR
jgi:hypothetical protein